jgi:hypothetical protein
MLSRLGGIAVMGRSVAPRDRRFGVGVSSSARGIRPPTGAVHGRLLDAAIEGTIDVIAEYRGDPPPRVR